MMRSSSLSDSLLDVVAVDGMGVGVGNKVIGDLWELWPLKWVNVVGVGGRHCNSAKCAVAWVNYCTVQEGFVVWGIFFLMQMWMMMMLEWILGADVFWLRCYSFVLSLLMMMLLLRMTNLSRMPMMQGICEVRSLEAGWSGVVLR